ncbi:MAG TPA: hypothetical protein DEA52_06530 [Clostridiaceae bacterium]|nr:hypothetical protein [Clostridiaceae bacterium]
MGKRILGSFLMMMLLFMVGCTIEEEPMPAEEGIRGIFSWTSSMHLEDLDTFIKVMDHLELNTVFQTISSSADVADVQMFLERAAKENLSVYALTGDPSWGLDEEGESMIRRIERMAWINEHVPKDHGFKGIVMDVEPYLLPEFKEDQEEIMAAFVSGLKKAYEVAKSKELEFIVCIPYYYDHWMLEEALYEIIVEASDQVAVMNYYVGKELEHLSLEATYAKEAKKDMMTIYEMKPPGTHGLTERNTYYALGFSAVEENFTAIQEALAEQRIHLVYHDYNAVKELLGYE